MKKRRWRTNLKINLKMTGFIWIKNKKRSTYDLELDEFGWYKYIMFHRRRSIFCRVWLNSKTFTHVAFFTHTNHATHAKISTHVTHVTHAKILWTHSTHATHAKIWPTPPTHPSYPRHPRDLADSFMTLGLCAIGILFLTVQ